MSCVLSSGRPRGLYSCLWRWNERSIFNRRFLRVFHAVPTRYGSEGGAIRAVSRYGSEGLFFRAVTLDFFGSLIQDSYYAPKAYPFGPEIPTNN